MARRVARLGRLEPGTHLCRFDDDEASLDRGGAAFVWHGLAAGRRVVYVTDGRDPKRVEAALQDSGVPAGRALAAGQLMFCDFEELYAGNPPHPGVLEAGYRSLHAQAVADGLAGLWVAAEMNEAASRFGSLEQLLRWERLATSWQREIGVSTVCQYDRRRLSSAELELVAAEHAGLAPEEAPAPACGVLTDEKGFRIEGEIDVSNVEQLLSALEARLAVQPRLTLDLAELGFVDVGTLRALFRLVRERGDIELTLSNASPAVRRCLELTGFNDSRVVVS